MARTRGHRRRRTPKNRDKYLQAQGPPEGVVILDLGGPGMPGAKPHFKRPRSTVKRGVIVGAR